MAGKQDVPSWDPDAPRLEYTYAAVASHIVARIKAGEIPPGAALPGERSLSSEYGVAIGTIRRAIRDLVERGWLIVLKSKGTYVKPADQWPED